MSDYTLHEGDCLDVMRLMATDSVDAICTDPPYGLGFMGKEWDAPGKSFVERKPAKKNRFDHVGGNHNPTCSADGARTARVENQKAQVWHEQWATEALRVLKPGGHLLAFGGTRAYHRLACAIEDAGFEIRDSIRVFGTEEETVAPAAWVYGSGFPKSLDVSKAIDKAGGRAAPPNFASWLRSERQKRGFTTNELCEKGGFYKNVNHGGLVSNWEAGIGLPDAQQFNLLCDLLELPFERRDEVERKILGWKSVVPGVAFTSDGPSELPVTASATDAARQWEGFGTALKPAHEPIVVARKPLSGTVAANILTHGTGGLNIDGCRVEASATDDGVARSRRTGETDTVVGFGFHRADAEMHNAPGSVGRWPPNIVLTHASTCEDGACDPACPVRLLDEQSGISKSTTHSRGNGRTHRGIYGAPSADPQGVVGPVDTGGASRFFPIFKYAAKASTRERTLPDGTRHTHPTTKPLSLMRWLVRLVTPPHGVVLDPFMGSGTTGVGCLHEGFRFIGIEREPEYMAIARQRMGATGQQRLPLTVTPPPCNGSDVGE